MGEALPKFEEVKHEMKELKGFSGYFVHLKLGKIFNSKSGKWLLVNAKGVGDQGYFLTALKHDSGVWVMLYEHEAVIAASMNVEPKSWRKNGQKLEIDHIDKNVKNNSINNIRLVTSKINKKNQERTKINFLTQKNADEVRELFKKWEGKKTDFYIEMSKKYGVGKRSIQNAVLLTTYRPKYIVINQFGVVETTEQKYFINEN